MFSGGGLAAGGIGIAGNRVARIANQAILVTGRTSADAAIGDHGQAGAWSGGIQLRFGNCAGKNIGDATKHKQRAHKNLSVDRFQVIRAGLLEFMQESKSPHQISHARNLNRQFTSCSGGDIDWREDLNLWPPGPEPNEKSNLSASFGAA
ncbi:MAG: hypothetical protein ABSB30_00620 [Terracidiphilus sp.]|jgi:hypothetical protein